MFGDERKIKFTAMATPEDLKVRFVSAISIIDAGTATTSAPCRG
jgi:hypothetical protein